MRNRAAERAVPRLLRAGARDRPGYGSFGFGLKRSAMRRRRPGPQIVLRPLRGNLHAADQRVAVPPAVANRVVSVVWFGDDVDRPCRATAAVG